MENNDTASNYVNFVISPHLDDAVFSLGGLLVKESEKTKVITIFSGIPTKPLTRIWDLICGFKDSSSAMNKRIEENNLALCYLGVPKENIVNFSYLDRQYRHSFFKKSEVPEAEISESITRELKKFTTAEKTENVRIFAPMFSLHEDHKIARRIATLLLNNNSSKKINLYLYQDMPYFYSNYLKKLLKNISISKEQILGNIKPEGLNCEREIIELKDQEFSKKMTASKLYDSQFTSKFSKISSLPRKQYFISKMQTKIFKTKSPHCEVVYKVI